MAGLQAPLSTLRLAPPRRRSKNALHYVLQHIRCVNYARRDLCGGIQYGRLYRDRNRFSAPRRPDPLETTHAVRQAAERTHADRMCVCRFDTVANQ